MTATYNLRTSSFRQTALPYCLQKMESNAHRHVWLPLNRRYKPLGMMTKDWIDYVDHIAGALVFKRDPTTFKDIWNGSIRETRCYIYNDGTDLDAVYFKSLQRLLAHEHSYYGSTKESRDHVRVANVPSIAS